MSLNFKYIPLTFLKDLNQVKEQVRNTIILSHFFDKNKSSIKLKNLIEGTQYGYNASALEAGRNKFLRISDITNGIVNWETVPFCDCSDEETYLLQKDDLLIARTGGTTGKSFLIDTPPPKAIYAGYLIRIRANKANDPEFLNLFLNSYVYWSQVLSLNKGEFRPSVNATKLKELILPKCSVQEQKEAVRISNGETLSGYEDLTKRIRKALLDFDKSQGVLTEYETQKLLLSQLKQSILQEAIKGKLTANWRAQNPNTEPASELLKRIKAEKNQLIKDKKIKREKALPPITEEEIPFQLPDGWAWCQLGEIINLKSGQDLKPSEYSDTEVIGLPYVTGASNLKNERVIISRWTNVPRSVAFRGDLLITCKGSGVGKMGWLDEESAHIARQIMAISTYCSSLEYIKVLMDVNAMIYRKNAIGLIPGIDRKTVLETLVSFPPLEEQKAIVGKVESLIQKCQTLEQEIEISEANAQMLMQAVLKEAFEGKQEVVC